jgi:hypothetical protein
MTAVVRLNAIGECECYYHGIFVIADTRALMMMFVQTIKLSFNHHRRT